MSCITLKTTKIFKVSFSLTRLKWYLFEILFPAALYEVIRQLIELPQVIQNSARTNQTKS